MANILWIKGNKKYGVSIRRVSGKSLIGTKKKYAWRIYKWKNGQTVMTSTYLSRKEAIREARHLAE